MLQFPKKTTCWKRGPRPIYIEQPNFGLLSKSGTVGGWNWNTSLKAQLFEGDFSIHLQLIISLSSNLSTLVFLMFPVVIMKKSNISWDLLRIGKVIFIKLLVIQLVLSICYNFQRKPLDYYTWSRALKSTSLLLDFCWSPRLLGGWK